MESTHVYNWWPLEALVAWINYVSRIILFLTFDLVDCLTLPATDAVLHGIGRFSWLFVWIIWVAFFVRHEPALIGPHTHATYLIRYPWTKNYHVLCTALHNHNRDSGQSNGVLWLHTTLVPLKAQGRVPRGEFSSQVWGSSIHDTRKMKRFCRIASW